MRPNHHYATHTAEFIRNFGPAAGFWSFIFERLNKVLKGTNHNNHGHGTIESTFLKQFILAQNVSRRVCYREFYKIQFANCPYPYRY